MNRLKASTWDVRLGGDFYFHHGFSGQPIAPLPGVRITLNSLLWASWDFSGAICFPATRKSKTYRVMHTHIPGYIAIHELRYYGRNITFFLATRVESTDVWNRDNPKFKSLVPTGNQPAKLRFYYKGEFIHEYSRPGLVRSHRYLSTQIQEKLVEIMFRRFPIERPKIRR